MRASFKFIPPKGLFCRLLTGLPLGVSFGLDSPTLGESIIREGIRFLASDSHLCELNDGRMSVRTTTPEVLLNVHRMHIVLLGRNMSMQPAPGSVCLACRALTN
jgi:hypothetical protein